MMFKRSLAFTLSVIIILITSFNNVSAASLIPSDDSTHYYFGNHFDFNNWNQDDLLTNANYDANVLVSNELGGDLSNDTVKTFYSNNGAFTDSALYYTLTGDYTVDTNKLDINNTYFKPIVVDNNIIDISDCKKVVGIVYGSNLLYCVLLYSPSNSDIAFGTGARSGFFSSEPFYMSNAVFPLSLTNYDGNTIFQFSDAISLNQVSSSVMNQHGFPTDSQAVRLDDLSNIFYSDVTILFQALENNNTFGENSVYRYDLLNNYGTAWLNDSDTTGFVVDRRSAAFISKVEEQDSSVVRDQIDYSLYNGKLGFMYFNSLPSTNYDFSKNKYKPFISTTYTLNNYSELHKDDIELKFKLKLELNAYWLTYGNENPNQQQIVLDMDFVGEEFNLITNGEYFYTDVNSVFNSYKYKSFRGIRIVDEKWQSADTIDTTQDLIDYGFNLKNYRSLSFSGNYISTFKLYLTCYLYDTQTGGSSDYYTCTFDLWGNTFSDNKNNIIYNDDQDYNNFIHSFDVLDDGTDKKPIDYAQYDNNNNVSLGNVYINNPEYPYVLVDIPENEWMNKTPNLTSILTDFKSMLAETKEDSVLTMLPQTYSYFPAPVMQYLLYGVGLIVMIGIWRAITRR